MLIHDTMSLSDLQQAMGDVTIEEAESMRSILLFEGWMGADTIDITAGEWACMSLQACDHSDEPSCSER